MRNARKHIMFCIELYTEQIRGGRYFLHGDPNSAKSWMMLEVVDLAAQPGVEMTVWDVCAYDMKPVDKYLEATPVRKCRNNLTNCDEVAKRIRRRYSNREGSMTTLRLSLRCLANPSELLQS